MSSPTSQELKQDASAGVALRLRARRSAGFLRICVFMPLGVLGLIWAYRVCRALEFKASAVSSRITEYSVAFVMLLIALAGVGLGVAGARWLLFALWPGRLGLFVDDLYMKIALGPFGVTQLDLDRLTATYRFERDEDDEDDEDEALSTEDFLDPEIERQTRLPILRHPAMAESINLTLDKFIAGTELEVLQQLRPMIDRVRNR